MFQIDYKQKHQKSTFSVQSQCSKPNVVLNKSAVTCDEGVLGVHV